MKRNIELLTRVRDHIVAHPESHDQNWWGRLGEGATVLEVDNGLFVVEPSCGTAACVAGWACLLNGDKPAVSKYYLPDGPDYVAYSQVQSKSGKYHHIKVRARKLLGISRYEADVLFEYSRTYDEVLDILALLIGGRGLSSLNLTDPDE